MQISLKIALPRVTFAYFSLYEEGSKSTALWICIVSVIELLTHGLEVCK